jgi:hypothetical protein
MSFPIESSQSAPKHANIMKTFSECCHVVPRDTLRFHYFSVLHDATLVSLKRVQHKDILYASNSIVEVIHSSDGIGFIKYS